MFTVRQVGQTYYIHVTFAGIPCGSCCVGPDFGFISGRRVVLDSFWRAQQRAADRWCAQYAPQILWAPTAWLAS